MTHKTSGISKKIKVNGQKLENVASFKYLGSLVSIWWGFQGWGTLQDSTDDSSTDKVETSLEWPEHFFQFQDTTDALPCHSHLPVCLLIMDPHSRAAKKNTSHWNEVLLQDTTHFIQRPPDQWESLCQDSAGNWPIGRLPDHHKEMQIEVIWTHLPFIRSCQTISQGTVKGGRRRGRQKKRLEDNIRQWTGLELAKSQRAVENREKWRKLVVKLSVVPQQPVQWRDRWRWRWRH